LEQVGKLTDRQIEEIYFHPRNPMGEIEPVKGERRAGLRTMEHELMKVDVLAFQLGLTPENVAEMKSKIREKWQEN